MEKAAVWDTERQNKTENNHIETTIHQLHLRTSHHNTTHNRQTTTPTQYKNTIISQKRKVIPNGRKKSTHNYRKRYHHTTKDIIHFEKWIQGFFKYSHIFTPVKWLPIPMMLFISGQWMWTNSFIAFVTCQWAFAYRFRCVTSVKRKRKSKHFNRISHEWLYWWVKVCIEMSILTKYRNLCSRTNPEHAVEIYLSVFRFFRYSNRNWLRCVYFM